MSILEGIRSTYSMFGVNGLLLTTKSRLFQRQIEALVVVPDILHPVWIRLRSSDTSVLWQVFGIAEYDADFCKPPRIIVDAGANIGLTSIFFANKYPEARVFAIEPETSNYEIMKKNTACYSNIIPIRAALWKNNTELSVFDPGLGKYGFQTMDGIEKRAALERVCGLTIDKLMADYNLDQIDILKIDIEGSEKEIFENASSWTGRVGVIEVEMHDRIKTGCSRVVYLATKDFDFQYHKGETIFLVRKEYMPKGFIKIGDSVVSSQEDAKSAASKLPFKIISSV